MSQVSIPVTIPGVVGVSPIFLIFFNVALGLSFWFKFIPFFTGYRST